MKKWSREELNVTGKTEYMYKSYLDVIEGRNKYMSARPILKCDEQKTRVLIRIEVSGHQPRYTLKWISIFEAEIVSVTEKQFMFYDPLTKKCKRAKIDGFYYVAEEGCQC